MTFTPGGGKRCRVRGCGCLHFPGLDNSGSDDDGDNGDGDNDYDTKIY